LHPGGLKLVGILKLTEHSHRPAALRENRTLSPIKSLLKPDDINVKVKLPDVVVPDVEASESIESARLISIIPFNEAPDGKTPLTETNSSTGVFATLPNEIDSDNCARAI